MKALFLTMFATLCVAGSASAQIPAFNGKWKLNHEQTLGPTADVEMITYEINGDEEHYIVEETGPGDRKFKTEYRAKFDGRTYENKNLVTGTTAYVMLRKVYDRCEQVTNIRDGKVVGYYIRVLSPDGKQITSTLTDAAGQVTNVRVFDKVSN